MEHCERSTEGRGRPWKMVLDEEGLWVARGSGLVVPCRHGRARLTGGMVGLRSFLGGACSGPSWRSLCRVGFVRIKLALEGPRWHGTDQVGSGGSKMALCGSSWLWIVRDGIATLGVRMPSWRFVSLAALCGVCCVELDSPVASGLAVAFAVAVAVAVLRSCVGRSCAGRWPPRFLRSMVIPNIDG